MQTVTVIIDRHALRHNLNYLRKLIPNGKLVSIVKANAYGHGLIQTAQVIADNSDAFGVARMEEALYLRNHGIIQPILLLEGFIDKRDLLVISEQNFHTVIHNEEQLCALETTRLSNPVTVWMKIDTGMHRLGIHPERASSFYRRLCQCNNIYQPINIMSHLSSINASEYNITKRQLNIFNSFCIGKPGMHSIASSSGILLWPQSHFNCVRPGIALYGISPFNDKSYGSNLGLQPVMSLTSRLIAVRTHKANNPVGYNSTWISKQDTCLGVVAIGYGDGYPRIESSGTPVLINGREVPIVGSVSMDMICVDLGPQTSDKVGDIVTLWGKDLPVERISQVTGINVYELVTKLTSRVNIQFLN